MNLNEEVLLKNRYIIKKQISRGELTQTYQAYDKVNNHKVVLKILDLSEMKEWNALENFEREVQFLKNIKHPGIPELIEEFELDHEGKKLYVLVLTYLKGDSLYNLIRNGKKFNLDEVLVIFVKLLKIVEYIHGLLPPIIHRDINPKNIILDNRENIFLIDFNALGSTAKSSIPSELFVGSPGYSDEQNQGKIIPQLDIYSIGVTLIFLLTGKNPMEIEVKEGILQYKSFVGIPDFITSIIDKMIHPDLNIRFKSINDVLEQLSRNYTLKQDPQERKKNQKEITTLELNLDLESRDELGLTPLMIEVKHNRYDTAKLMLEKGAKVNTIDNSGFSLLNYAVKNNNEKMIKLLINYKVDLNARNNEGQSALIYAAQNKLAEMVKLLIRNGVPVNQKDKLNNTPLKYAIQNNDKSMIEILIKAGASLEGIDIEQEIIKEVLNREKDAQDLDKQDNAGQTDLMKAIFDYNDDKAKILITKGANLDLKDKKGKAAIIYTIIHERFDIAQLLLEKGADVDTVDNKGMTALMWACDRGSYKIAEWLVEKGADVNAKDKQGNPVSYYATTKKTKNILRKAGVNHS